MGDSPGEGPPSDLDGDPAARSPLLHASMGSPQGRGYSGRKRGRRGVSQTRQCLEQAWILDDTQRPQNSLRKVVLRPRPVGGAEPRPDLPGGGVRGQNQAP